MSTQPTVQALQEELLNRLVVLNESGVVADREVLEHLCSQCLIDKHGEPNYDLMNIIEELGFGVIKNITVDLYGWTSAMLVTDNYALSFRRIEPWE